MNIHEYQAKELMRRYGIAVPDGGVAWTPDEAVQQAEKTGGPVWVVKSQIHAGGRGAGRFRNDPDGKGGVRVVKSVDEVRANADAMLGQVLVTKQTGPEGKEVKRLYIEDGCDIARELYLSVLLDRATSRVTVMASTEGGMDIEQVAEETPEKIIRVAIDPATGIQAHHCRTVAFGLGLAGTQVKSATRFLTAMYKAFTELDASLVEINPLVVTGEGEVLALDAKMNFDDNALYRHEEVAAMRDEDEEDPLEVEASKFNLNYIKLDGSVACMVNGAGLAMATMDIIKLAGAAPANFLDVGGGASKEMVENAFRILMDDPDVKAVFINIFGGILRCDILAEGVVEAVKTVNVNVPIIIRMEGTNVEKGREILEGSGLDFTVGKGMADSAEKVVAALNR
ncbi:MAG: ADP-forming succinate--CoA ligase subunit beta [Rhodospirillaceae bacterium]|nr:ADP-forming succinate--CoA ligase subunit beta [Rhodospirillaceae bacterium]